jgi:2-dehydropantoate 2-reductase
VRIAVMGAGALGGFYGGLMARSGEDVTFVARGRTLEVLRADGLTVGSKLAGDFALPVAATDDPSGMAPVDLVLFGVKAYDLEAAAARVRPLVGPETMVLSLLNGVDNGDRLGRIVGAQAVVDGAVYVSATVEAPGRIAQIGGPGLVRFGEHSGPRTPRLDRLKDLFERIGVPSVVHDDMRVPLWEKFMAICAMSGVSALTRLTLRQIFDCPETRAFYRDVMVEAVAVGRAHGVDLPENAADDMLQMLLTMPALPERGSMAYDLLAGRRLELATLNGTVVRLGHDHDLPTPSNAAIYAALKPYADGPPDATA